jgi:hypothetical protein
MKVLVKEVFQMNFKRLSVKGVKGVYLKTLTVKGVYLKALTVKGVYLKTLMVKGVHLKALTVKGVYLKTLIDHHVQKFQSPSKISQIH